MSDYEWTVEVTPAARAAISRAIKDRYDGRELGDALVGHTYDDRIVVTNANGLGSVGVETPRGDTWFRPSRARWYEFAQACGAELLGDWHCHPDGGTVAPSNVDVRAWQAMRKALRSPVYLGLIFLPRKVHVIYIHLLWYAMPAVAIGRAAADYGLTWRFYAAVTTVVTRWSPPVALPVHVGAPTHPATSLGTGTLTQPCARYLLARLPS